jgi:diguanylate cyclase (GGDEF)-like protein
MVVPGGPQRPDAALRQRGGSRRLPAPTRPTGRRAGGRLHPGELHGARDRRAAHRDRPGRPPRRRGPHPARARCRTHRRPAGALQALEQVQRQASLDGLTGLPNRRTFEDGVRRLRTAGRRYGVLLADLDRFKTINDTFGHAAGDQALRRFADVLRGCLREQDLPCRFGGEEFAVAIPGADAAETAAIAERLRGALAASALEATGPTFTASVGVADSLLAGTLSDQLALADAALLAAERSGRDRVLVARAAAEPAPTATAAASGAEAELVSEVPGEASR